MLEKILESLEVRGDEAKVYSYLLRHGAFGVGALAKNLSLARPTLYDVLGRLRDKGLVMQSIRRGIRSYQAEAPRKLELMLKNKIVALNETHEKLYDMLPMLEARRSAQSLPPRFQMFDGAEGVKNVLMDMLTYRDIPTYSFWSIKSARALLGSDFFKHHNTQRIRANISVQAIWPKTQVVNIKQYPFLGGGPAFRREIRQAPEGIECRMGYWIYADKVAFLSSSTECYGFIVESAECTEMMLAQHQFIWRSALPIATNPDDVREFLRGV